MSIEETPPVLTPGEQIKPQLCLDEAIKLAEVLYGLRGVTGVELNGYDDKNIHLKVTLNFIKLDRVDSKFFHFRF